MVQPSERDLGDLRLPTEQVEHAVGHYRVMADRKVLEAGAVYHGAILLSNGSGASIVAVYDGNDNSGDLLDRLETSGASKSVTSYPAVPLRAQRGIYVDLGSNVDQFVLFADPPPAEHM